VPLGWSSAALRRVKALWLKMAPADRLTQSLVAVGALGACVLGFRLYKRHARAAKKAHRNSQLLDYALAAVASWQLALDTPQDLEISPVSGGLSNYIYLVQLRPAVAAALAAEGLLLGSGGRVPRRVILRVFGENRDVLLDGEREIAVSQALSDLGLGVRVFGGTDEYRCEEFIVGKAMTRAVFASNAGLRNQALARVAALHDSSEAITGKMKGMGLPVHLGTAQLWVNMDRWLALIPHSHMLRSTLERELEWLRGRVQQCPSDSALSDLVFCHNDCQELNFMIDDAETKVEQMIDYEYAGVNMRGFDLAQVVNETYIDNEAEGYPGYLPGALHDQCSNVCAFVCYSFFTFHTITPPVPGSRWSRLTLKTPSCVRV
jgi:thiamine kinase-like enzyme